jgi:hypothetical protein
MAKEYLKSGAVEEALGYLQLVLSMPDTKGMTRTKVQAAKSSLANAAKISSKRTQLQLDGSVTSLSMSDLLALAHEQAGPPAAIAGSPQAPAALEGSASEAGLEPLLGAGEEPQEAAEGVGGYLTKAHGGSSEPTEGHGRTPTGPAPADAPRGDERKEDPTEGLGDTSSSVGGAS